MRADYLLNSGNSIIKVFIFIFKVKFNEFRGEEALDSRIGWINTGHWILRNGYWRMEIGVWTLDTWSVDTGHWILGNGDWRLEIGV